MKQLLSQWMDGAEGADHPLDALVRLGAQYCLQVGIEHEVTEFLGRAHYQRRGEGLRGYRNGYEPKALKTPVGLLGLALPQTRQTAQPFRSRLVARLGTDGAALHRLVTGMYVRGLSIRDVEGLFQDTFGQRIVSKSGVSQITAQLGESFRQWRERDLSQLNVVYLFLDAIYLAARAGTDEKEGVLAAYGLLEDGKKVLLHLALGSRESYDAWLSFLHDLTARGLHEPLLVIIDGNPGLKKALREVFPHALRQRCQVHKMRNILAKLPRSIQAKMKRLIHQVFHAASYDEGLRRGRALIGRFQARYPSAMACLEEDLEACLVHLKFPREHHVRLRTTNLLERTFGEGRRRTKVIGRFPTEAACLQLLYATLITASQTWRGVQMTPAILRQLDAIRHALFPMNHAGQVSAAATCLQEA
jgi:transposase-like protein